MNAQHAQAEYDLMTGIMLGACISWLKRAYRFHADVNERIATFERNASFEEISALYRTIEMLKSQNI